jgi:hypothetical protein
MRKHIIRKFPNRLNVPKGARTPTVGLMVYCNMLDNGLVHILSFLHLWADLCQA